MTVQLYVVGSGRSGGSAGTTNVNVNGYGLPGQVAGGFASVISCPSQPYDLPFVPFVPFVPSAPSAPSLPGWPSRPLAPSWPSLPAAPSLPGRPCLPGVPGAPGVPSTPAAPTQRLAWSKHGGLVPSRPGGPGGPCAPVAPVSPGGPGIGSWMISLVLVQSPASLSFLAGAPPALHIVCTSSARSFLSWACWT